MANSVALSTGILVAHGNSPCGYLSVDALPSLAVRFSGGINRPLSGIVNVAAGIGFKFAPVVTVYT